MKNILLKKLQVFGLAFIYTIIVNAITRLYLGYGPFARYFLIDFSIMALVLGPIFLFKNRWFSFSYGIFFVFLSTIIFIINGVYYKNLDTPAYLSLLKNLGEAKYVVNASQIHWPTIILGLLLLLVYIFLSLFLDKVYKYPECTSFYTPFGIIISLFVMVLSFTTHTVTVGVIYKQYEDVTYTEGCHNGYEVINFHTQYLKASSFRTFGMYGCYMSEYSLNWGEGSCGDPIDNNDNTDKYLNEHAEEFEGLLSGYNVITIMIETGIYDAITEEFTPNLYRLQNNGINCINNYSKNKTSVSEIIGFTGSFPTYGIDYNYDQKSDTSIYKLLVNIPTTLPKLLNNDYETKFFHDGMGLYARNSLMGQFGFEDWKHEFYQENPYGDPAWDFDGSYRLDSRYIDIVLEKMIPENDRFYTFWTTLSTHGPYTETYQGRTAVQDRDQLFIDLGYAAHFDSKYEEVYGPIYGKLDNDTYKHLKHFICAFMNLDEAVGKIIKRCEDLEIFDNTLFVVYGDHEAYYQKLSQSLTKLDAKRPENYHTTLFFSNPTLKEKYEELYEKDVPEFEYFTSPYQIVPTILDLLGVDYSLKDYYSPSIFKYHSKFDGLFYSNEYSAFMTDMIYSSEAEKFEWLNSKLTDEDILDIINIQYQRLSKLSQIDSLYNDYFSYKD